MNKMKLLWDGHRTDSFTAILWQNVKFVIFHLFLPNIRKEILVRAVYIYFFVFLEFFAILIHESLAKTE